VPVRFGTLTLIKTAPHAAKLQGVIGPFVEGLICLTHVWASDRGAVSVARGPLDGPVFPGERPDFHFPQITSPLNGPVNYLKSLNADVCELAKRAESSLRATQNEDVKRLEDDVR